MSELEGAYAELWIEMAQRHLDAGMEIGDEWRTIVRSRSGARAASWAEVGLQADSYTVTLHPSSALSDDPAGRRDEVVSMMQSGLVDRAEARQLAGLADLAKSNDLATAQRDVIERVYESIIAGEMVDPPSPMYDLAAAVKLGTSYWALAKRDGADPAIVDEIERWTLAAMEMLRSEEDAQPPSADAMAADPDAALKLAQASQVGA
jgi:hypothetical protein